MSSLQFVEKKYFFFDIISIVKRSFLYEALKNV